MVFPLIAAAAIGAAGSAYAAKKTSDANVQNTNSTNQTNLDISRETNAKAIELARENNEWSERLSNTAYERAMSDMRRAGLNPILAGNLGGATTPGLQQPNLHVPTMQAPTESDWLGAGINSAGSLGAQLVGAEKTLQEVENLKSTQGLTEDQRAKVAQEINNLQEVAIGIHADNAMKEVRNDAVRGAGIQEAAENLARGLKETVLLENEWVNEAASRIGIGVYDFVDMLKEWAAEYISPLKPGLTVE
jgi:hypothetical protein